MSDNPAAGDKKDTTDAAPDDGRVLKRLGGSQSDAWNKHIAGQTFRALSPINPATRNCATDNET
jgi:hypothetical protein